MSWPQEPLAYVEWYSALKSTAEPYHLMYSVRKQLRSDGTPTGSIIPLHHIRQSCMLFPNFGTKANKDWTTNNVLDKSSSFILNNWQSLYTYKTIW